MILKFMFVNTKSGLLMHTFHCVYICSSHCDGKYSKYTNDIESRELLARDNAHGSEGRLYHLH